MQYRNIAIATATATFLLMSCDGSVVADGTSVCDCPAPALIPHDHPHEHEVAPPLYLAGTRLAPLMITAPDGSSGPAPNAWFDSSLGTDCAYAPAPNGTFVCMPRTAPVQSFYADAMCQQKIAVAAACDDLPKYGRETKPDGCGSLGVGTLYHLDMDNVIANAPIYYFGSSGCQIQPNALGTTNVALMVLDALPEPALVEATVEPAPSP